MLDQFAQSQVGVLALSLLLAVLVEGGVEYLLGTPMDKVPKLKGFKWALMYIGMGAGVALAFFYQLDLMALVTGTPVSDVGIALTGGLIGRGSNFVNQFVSTYLPGAKAPKIQVLQAPQIRQNK